jgi:hypothetical protein
MFRGFSKCQNCGSELIDGPDVERSSQRSLFTCDVIHIPTKICPRGCTGQYWYWLDFGIEAIEALEPDSPNIAKRKFGLFKIRDFCRKCNVELENRHESTSFTFHQKLKKGTDLQITVNAPSLTCPQCASYFLPAQKSSWDDYYVELCDVIQEAITRDLIYE